MKVAALDLGSNTFLCLICIVNAENRQVTQVISDQVEIVRLGQGVSQTGCFQEEALVRADNCLQRFSAEIQKHQPDYVIAVATAAARMASNKQRLFEICHKHHIPLKIISGDQEAEITFAGAISKLQTTPSLSSAGVAPTSANESQILNSQSSYIVIDIGGASTEIILGCKEAEGDNFLLNWKKSFPIGAVKLTEQQIPMQPVPNPQLKTQELQNSLKDMFQEIDELLSMKKNSKIVAVAGTPTEIAKIMNHGVWDEHVIDGFQITLPMLKQLLQDFMQTSVLEKIQRWHVTPGRADVILAGVILLTYILEKIGSAELTVSTRGVRYGVAMRAQNLSQN